MCLRSIYEWSRNKPFSLKRHMIYYLLLPTGFKTFLRPCGSPAYWLSTFSRRLEGLEAKGHVVIYACQMPANFDLLNPLIAQPNVLRLAFKLFFSINFDPYN